MTKRPISTEAEVCSGAVSEHATLDREEGIKRQLALFEEFNLDWPQWMSFAAHYCPAPLHHILPLVIDCTAMYTGQITGLHTMPSSLMGCSAQPNKKET